MTARTFLAVEEEEGAVPSTKEAVFFRPVLSNYPINLSIIWAISDIVPSILLKYMGLSVHQISPKPLQVDS